QNSIALVKHRFEDLMRIMYTVFRETYKFKPTPPPLALVAAQANSTRLVKKITSNAKNEADTDKALSTPHPENKPSVDESGTDGTL
ncbi:hypothetical protein STEG23_038431, partial [Scotinomys teguina]